MCRSPPSFVRICVLDGHDLTARVVLAQETRISMLRQTSTATPWRFARRIDAEGEARQDGGTFNAG